MVLIVWIGFASAEQRASAVDSEFRRDLLRNAVTMASSLEPDRVRELSFREKDAERDAYRKIADLMTAYRALTDTSGDIISLQRRNGSLYFGPFARSNHSAQTMEPGTRYANPPEALLAAYDSKRALVTGPHEDEHGRFISAFAPVIDPQTDELLMMLGFNVRASDWRTLMVSAKRGPQARSLALVLLLVVSSLLLWHKQRLPPERQVAWRRLEPALIAVYGVAFVTVVSVWMYDSENRERRAVFMQVAEMHAELTKDEFLLLNLRAKALTSLYTASDYVTSGDFEEFAPALLHARAVRAVGWIPNMEDQRPDSIPDPSGGEPLRSVPIWKWEASATNRVPQDAAGTWPALYIQPAARQTALLGFDHASIPLLRSGIERALTSPRRIGSALMRWPPWDESAPTRYFLYRPVSSRSGQQDGVILLVMDLQSLINDAFDRLIYETPLVTIRLTDMSDAQPIHRVIYPPDSDAHDCSHDEQDTYTEPILAMGHTFEFKACPTPEFFQTYPARGAFLIWLAGIALTGLITATTGILRQRQHSQMVGESEKRYRQLFSSMSSAFILCEVVKDEFGHPNDLRVLEVNEAFAKYTDMDRASLPGQSLSAAMPHTYPIWLSRFVDVAQTGRSTHFTHFNLNRERHYDVLAYRPEPGQCAVMLTDITESKRLEQQLEQLEALQRTLIQMAMRFINIPSDEIEHTTDDALAEIGRFTRADRAYQFRYDLEQMVMINTHEWCAEAIRPAMRESQSIPFDTDLDQWKAHKAGKPYHLPKVSDLPSDHPLLSIFEEQMIQSLITIPLMAGGECKGFVGFDAVREPRTWSDKEIALLEVFAQLLTNAYLRREMEEERLLLERQMQQTQKLESLGLLAGGIAHDFNNILTTILGNADLAVRDISSVAPARGRLDDIMTGARRAADLCRQMLAYAGKGRLVIETFSINELIEEMLHLLKTSISRRARFNRHLEPGLPPLRGDSSQIRQIILNLVLNASESLGDKSGIISIRTGADECTAQDILDGRFGDELSEGLYVTFEVTDTGHGMDEQTLSRIFDPFFTTKFTGRGLGLAAVLGIVRGHKGTLQVTSTPRQGSTFKLFLPAADVGAVDQGVPQTEDDTCADKDWKGTGTVLLVDDDPSIRALGRRMLERLGFYVLVAEDGVQALDIYHNNGDDLRCVVMDLTMPNKSGEDTFREFRELDPNLPVILASGYSQEDLDDRLKEQGFSAFIQKPFTTDTLGAMLRTVLNGERDEN